MSSAPPAAGRCCPGQRGEVGERGGRPRAGATPAPAEGRPGPVPVSRRRRSSRSRRRGSAASRACGSAPLLGASAGCPPGWASGPRPHRPRLTLRGRAGAAGLRRRGEAGHGPCPSPGARAAGCGLRVRRAARAPPIAPAPAGLRGASARPGAAASRSRLPGLSSPLSVPTPSVHAPPAAPAVTPSGGGRGVKLTHGPPLAV